jgi:hypothetical protein
MGIPPLADLPHDPYRFEASHSPADDLSNLPVSTDFVALELRDRSNTDIATAHVHVDELLGFLTRRFPSATCAPAETEGGCGASLYADRACARGRT